MAQFGPMKCQGWFAGDGIPGKILSQSFKDFLYQKGCFFPSDQWDAAMSPGTPAAILPP